jgi:hypothetical protein
MTFARRNIGTLTLILFAIAAFCTELAGALPEGIGATTTQVALVAMAAARGLVCATEALRAEKDDA